MVVVMNVIMFGALIVGLLSMLLLLLMFAPKDITDKIDSLINKLDNNQ